MVIRDALKAKHFQMSAALLWQKEATDTPSKSELLMFSYFTHAVYSSSRLNLKHSSC